MAVQQLWTNLVAKEMARPRRTTRTKTFTDKYPWLGPAMWILSILYFIAQIFAARVFRPSYSWSSNRISDLGNTSCGPTLCSPRHAWMNAEFFILGFVMAAGSLLIYQEFTQREADERLAARVGFSCLAIGGGGAVLVGWFPENTVHFLHIASAAVAIGIGTLGILVLGLVLRLPKKLRWGMRVAPPVALVALALYGFHFFLGLGAGIIERVAAYPETIWLIVFGVYTSRTRYSRSAMIWRGSEADGGLVTGHVEPVTKPGPSIR